MRRKKHACLHPAGFAPADRLPAPPVRIPAPPPLRKAIAIDFDGCLCADAYPNIGEPHWEVIAAALAARLNDGAGLILWTCREGKLLDDAVAACRSWGLTFDAINESLPDWIARYGTRPRKVGATEYWDDKARRVMHGKFE